MAFSVKNFSKAAFRSQITRKQNQFKRFKRRFNASKNPTEKRFIKNEAKHLCNELKQCSKQWKSFGFGACKWITKNCTMTGFGSMGVSRTNRKSNTTRSRSKAGRRYGRKTYARRSHGTRSSARRSTRSRSRNTRRYSVAW